jgi:hypothetical protein
MTAQTAWYAQIASALGKAVREKQRPALMASMSVAAP